MKSKKKVSKKAAKKKVSKKAAKKKVPRSKPSRNKKTANTEENKNESDDAFKFGISVNKLFGQLESLASSIYLAMEALKSEQKKKQKKMEEILDDVTIESNDNNVYKFTMHPDIYPSFNQNIKNIRSLNESIVQIPRAFLVSAVSQYDSYYASLIRDIFNVKPEIINTSEKKYSIGDISNYQSINEIKESAIDSIVDNLLRGTHKEQIKWLYDKVGLTGISLEPGVEFKFHEIMERRNLFVHCDGIVNHTYLRKLKEYNSKIGEKIKIDDKLYVPAEYFIEAIGILSYVALFLKQISWRKLLPHEKKDANSELITIGFDMIEKEHYELSNKIFDLSLSKEFINELDNESALICKLNKIQTLKWMGNEVEAKDYLEKCDWSGCSLEYTLAVSVLKNEFKVAKDIMISIGNKNDMFNVHSYKTWPIFKEFRMSKEFLEAFQIVFKEEYKDIVVDRPYLTKFMDDLKSQEKLKIVKKNTIH